MTSKAEYARRCRCLVIEEPVNSKETNAAKGDLRPISVFLAVFAAATTGS
jgi:hypothetical protein